MNKKNNILRFERNAEYYYERFERHADNFNYLDALVNIRRARELDPENDEYALSMAEVLTEMGIYDESNAILLPMYYRKSLYQDDVLFNLGCNFYGLRENEKAYDCFSQYVTLYPNADLVYDASDMIDMLSEEDVIEELPLTPAQNELADRGKYLIDCGDYAGAIEVLKQLTEECPGLHFAENNLSLAYYCLRDLQKAIFVANNILKSDPQNLHALSNLALFHYANGVPNSENIFLKKLPRLVPADGDDSFKLLLTYCELGEHKKAYNQLGRLLDEKPYDARALFIAGLISANIGEYKESFDYFDKMLRIDPMDSLALYYKEQIREALKGKPTEIFAYSYQVPTDEIRRRLDYLNQCTKMDMEALLDRWNSSDQTMRRIVLWGLYLIEPTIKRLSLELLNLIGDDFSINALKRYLLKENEPDDVKNDIFIMLNIHHVPLPYIAYINGRIAEVNLHPVGDPELPKILECHKEVMQRIASSSFSDKQSDLPAKSADILRRYCMKLGKAPVFRNYNTWAAALLYTALQFYNEDDLPSLDDLCAEFSAEHLGVSRCIKKIRSTLTEEP